MLIQLSMLLALVAQPADGNDDLFERRIRPVLAETCLTCHGGKATEANLSVKSRVALLAGGNRGPAIALEKVDESILLRALRHTDEGLAMPPGKRLPEEVIDDFERWIRSGAHWPEDASLSDVSAARQREHWTFQPLQEAAVPDVQNAMWPKTDIDRFVLARLEEKGLAPVQDAEKCALLRRVTFDLTGLPPTIDDLEAYLADQSADALERVIDRLLDSPGYGERWGRHWLDVVRYADTAGNPPDFPVPQAHRYRDYVIESLSKDKPFDQFIREQIAGDLLEATTDEERQEHIIATGYLAIARRYSGRKEGPDHLEAEDLIQNLGTSLLGLSLGCARCHDHKFDPVTQREYYALFGIFSSTRLPMPGGEGNYQQENFVALPKGGDAYAVGEGTPANARVQHGGDPGSLGDEVPRGFVSILGGHALATDATGSGRKELAIWLTEGGAKSQVARVIVNRIWQHHFGLGLVATSNDFGLRGTPPSHPELLDYLAVKLIDSGWSLKSIHRRLLLSRVYQLSAIGNSQNESVDPVNQWLWHFARRRLDAESIRDSLLAVSGSLDRTQAGEHPFPPKDQWKFSQHAPFVAVYESNRRSVYLMQQRIKKHPLLELFDGADANASTPYRLPTTTPLQSLFWMNDPLVHELAGRFTDLLLTQNSQDAGRIERAYLTLYARKPTLVEVERCESHLDRYKNSLRAAGTSEDRIEGLAWRGLARALFSSNEFLYVD